MATTPDSERLKALNLELDVLIDRYQQLAAESRDHDVIFLHICDILSDAQHRARRSVRLLEK